MLGLLFLGLLALGKLADAAPSPSPATTAPPATHTVTVGVDGYTFNPMSLTASPGDTVLFVFYPANHSVARAEYGYPCIPYENTGLNKQGFWSGFQPVDKPSDSSPTWKLTINDTEPTFFYCSADQACVPRGMIGVINPNATQTLANQMLFVKNATIQLSPGQQNPTESGSEPSSSSTSSPGGSSSSSSSGVSAGAIAGIVIGVLAVIALAGVAFYLCGRNRTLASVLRYSQPPKRPGTIPPLPYSPPPTTNASGSPFSPGYSPNKPDFPARSGINLHESWQTASTAVPLHPQSPEMAGSEPQMSPQYLSPTHLSGTYNAVENPANLTAYRGHPSPGETPWSPGGFNQMQYAQLPQGHDIHAGNEALDRPSSHGHQEGLAYDTIPTPEQPQVVHELDARSSVPESPDAPPPQYATRAFSFRQGGDAPPGVEKVLRD